MVKICPRPSVTKAVMVTKIRPGTEGTYSGAGISLKAASRKEQKWCLEIHAPCLIVDIIRQSLALP